jgi:hypothetical protein
MRFAIVNDIEPMAAPTFAIARGGEEAIDQLLISVGRRVGGEGLRLCKRRRKAVKIKREAANERAAVGFGGGTEPLFH